MRFFTLAVVGVAAWSLASPAVAAVALLNPSKDNTLIQTVLGTQELSNGQGDIFVGRTAQNGAGVTPSTISIRHGLVAFNLGSIPAGSIVTGVSLTLRDAMGNNGDISVDLHRLTRDWGEGSSFQNGGMGAAAETNDATWYSTFYGTDAEPWTNPGGDYISAPSATTIVVDQFDPEPKLPAGSLFTWSSAQMVVDVQDWLDDPSSNFGWLLKATDETIGQTAKRFGSGENTTPPLLQITYIVPEPSTWLLLAVGSVLCGVQALRRRVAGK